MTHSQHRLIRFPIAVVTAGVLLGAACASDDDLDDPTDIDVENPVDDPTGTLDDSDGAGTGGMGTDTPTTLGG
jgi:hypothetical protein